MDRGRHTVTKYLSGKKTQAAINSKLFKNLDHVNNALFEVEIVKARIEHKKNQFSSKFLSPLCKTAKIFLMY